MHFAYSAYPRVYLKGHDSRQSNIFSDTKNALLIPLAMCRLGRIGLLIRIGDTPPPPPLWDSSIRSSSMHKEKALIIEGEINSGRKKGLKGPGETQDGLHGKKKQGKGEKKKKLLEEPQLVVIKGEADLENSIECTR